MSGIDRIGEALARAAARPGPPAPALMAHAVLGWPDMAASRRVLAALGRAADLVEGQIPYSEPGADGPRIVAANHAAIRAPDAPAPARRVAACLGLLGQAGRDSGKPVLAMSYLNPILAFGAGAFVQEAAALGVDGLIVPDCPEDEPEPPLRELCAAAGLAFIPLIAPGTSLERAAALAAASPSPLLYVVLRAGVTGRRTELGAEALERLAALREATGRKVAAGFGIGERGQVEALAGNADCAVVGSALLAAGEAAREAGADPAERMEGLLRSLRP